MVENNRSEASELDGLPDADRKETQEIISEIEKEDKNNPDQPPAKPDAPKPEAPNKPEEGKEKKEEPKPGEEPKPSPRKPVKLMPSWVHESAMSQKDKTIGELTQKVEDLQKGKGPESSKIPPTPAQQASLESEVAKIAQEHSLKPELVKSLVDLGMKFGGKIPDEIREKLQKVDAFTEQAEVQAEEQAYNSAFDKEILPLIKKEYGDKVGEDTILEIREKLKEHAYSEEYKATPYAVIYKGIDAFRGYSRPPANSAEPSRGGFHNAPGQGPDADSDEFAAVTDDDIDRMDTATFERYTLWAEKNEKRGARA